LEPLHGALNPVALRIETALLGGGEHRPGTVDVVCAPATIPAAPGCLLLAQESPDTVQSGWVTVFAETAEQGGDTGADVASRRVEQGAVIGKRNFVEVVILVVGVECGEAAVTRLHGAEPVRGSPDGVTVMRITGLHHGPGGRRRVVEIGIRIITELEWPAAAGCFGMVALPVTGCVQQLALAQPVQATAGRGHAGLVTDCLQCQAAQTGVPYR